MEIKGGFTYTVYIIRLQNRAKIFRHTQTH